MTLFKTIVDFSTPQTLGSGQTAVANERGGCRPQAPTSRHPRQGTSHHDSLDVRHSGRQLRNRSEASLERVRLFSSSFQQSSISSFKKNKNSCVINQLLVMLVE